MSELAVNSEPMTTRKPVTKLPSKMLENIKMTSELIDKLHLIERRYLIGIFSTEEYSAATHDALAEARTRLTI